MFYLTNDDLRTVCLASIKPPRAYMIQFDSIYFQGCYYIRREFERNPGQVSPIIHFIHGQLK